MSNDTTTSGFSVNERAERLLGRRDANGPIGIFLDWPVELGYQCPVLGHQQTEADITVLVPPTLHWSEYNAFLWCEKCNRDYPSALCTGLSTDDPAQLERAIDVYLDTIENTIRRAILAHLAQIEAAAQSGCEATS